MAPEPLESLKTDSKMAGPFLLFNRGGVSALKLEQL